MEYIVQFGTDEGIFTERVEAKTVSAAKLKATHLYKARNTTLKQYKSYPRIALYDVKADPALSRIIAMKHVDSGVWMTSEVMLKKTGALSLCV